MATTREDAAMLTLPELEAAATAATAAYEAARSRLSDVQQAAQKAIMEHAAVQSRVVGGAGTQEDVDDAAGARDEALAALQAVSDELQPGRQAKQ